MIKLLIGGSPCTYWSIAQKYNRETTAEGLGWELFKNYLIAKEKFKPDFFLYENNKSAAQAIKDQIKHELGVWDGTLLMRDTGARYIEINSALVSAQNSQRFYVHNCGEVGQPEDRKIMLKDILESGVVDKDKLYCLKHQAGNTRDYFKKHHTQIAYEPVIEDCVLSDEYYHGGFKSALVGMVETPMLGRNGKQPSQNCRVYSSNDKSICLGTDSRNRIIAPYEGQVVDYGEPVNACEGGKARTIKAQYAKNGIANFITNGGHAATGVAEPICAIPTDKSIYEVKGGLITIKGKQYRINLHDGYYIIRKLTVTECERLQTLPDGYTQHAGVSETQCHKGIGNGWTAEVIIHILSNALKNVPKDERIIVLSMYDGIGTGRYCLDRMGFTNVEYHAYEIDKYAMKIAQSNYPDIIQHGDEFQVRGEEWNTRS